MCDSRVCTHMLCIFYFILHIMCVRARKHAINLNLVFLTEAEVQVVNCCLKIGISHPIFEQQDPNELRRDGSLLFRKVSLMSNNVKSYLGGHVTVNTGSLQNIANNAKAVGSAVNDFLQKGFDAQAQTKFMVPNPFVNNRVPSSPSGSGGGGDGGDGGISPISSAFYSDESGNVRPSDPNLDAMMKMIEQTTKANNEWSAAQAQKQMDFQKEMSSTAHQREVADLKAAGLNPVLSAGGSGASTPNGAQGDTDTSNTRIIADLAMAAIDSLGMSAAAFGAGAGSGTSRTGKSDSLFGKVSDLYATNRLVRKSVDSVFGATQYAAGGFAAKALMSLL